MAKFVFIEWLIDWIEQQQSFKFEWDDGNSVKNFTKHGVTCEEAESVFRQIQMVRVLGEQIAPPVDEPRYGLYGMTTTGKTVFLCFTLRGTGVRIISVRELNKKERVVYVDLCEE